VVPLTREDFDLSELIRNACELFKPLVEENRIELHCRLPHTLTIEGDIRMFQRMVANLVDNAVKYTRPQGSITIDLTVDTRQSNAVLSVQDTGIGIAEDDLPHIFERFYRCDRSRSMAGTGLGLSLARAVVQAHGGTIRVISKPDVGSTFTVSLPIH
jgi:signal transduction histidine kinase